MPARSELLSRVPGLRHGFGTRLEPVTADLAAAWGAGRPDWKQVHGITCAEVTAAGQKCGEADGVFALASGLPLGVVTADCVPILLARARGGAVAAVHAGWRGTRARILENLWKSLSARGEKPSEWVAAIGPSIGPCCYEVSPELAEEFRSEFGLQTSGRGVVGERQLDLPLVNESELKRLGLARVETLRACTRCSREPDGSPTYHSYRREGGGTRQYSLILA